MDWYHPYVATSSYNILGVEFSRERRQRADKFVARFKVDVSAPRIAVAHSVAPLTLQSLSGVHSGRQAAAFCFALEWTKPALAKCAVVAWHQLGVAKSVLCGGALLKGLASGVALCGWQFAAALDLHR